MMDEPGSARSGKSSKNSDELVGLVPIAAPNARLLVLGSMPGSCSLVEERYYAHPQNMFWPIMESMFGIPVELPYDKRVEGLRHSGVALWDVIGRCRRRGSLDQSIDPESVVVNDFGALFRHCRDIGKIGFNGRMAEKCWTRYVLPTLPGRIREIERVCLPSTSPANAAMSRDDKIKIWRNRLESPPAGIVWVP